MSVPPTAWYSEWTVVRGQAELPCLVPRPLDPSDKPLLALWYREAQPTVPIYRLVTIVPVYYNVLNNVISMYMTFLCRIPGREL